MGRGQTAVRVRDTRDGPPTHTLSRWHTHDLVVADIRQRVRWGHPTIYWFYDGTYRPIRTGVGKEQPTSDLDTLTLRSGDHYNQVWFFRGGSPTVPHWTGMHRMVIVGRVDPHLEQVTI